MLLEHYSTLYNIKPAEQQMDLLEEASVLAVS